MKSKFVNKTLTQGYIFNHTLQARTSAKGVDYIGGRINVATDDEGLNVVPVDFIYVTEKYGSGKDNPNYAILMDIIDNGVTFEVAGTDATRVRIDGSIGVNDFVNRDGEMVSSKRAVGSFVNIMRPGENLRKGEDFEADCVFTSCVEREVEDGDDYCQISGYTFDFRNNLVPVTFSVRSKGGIDYFLGQDMSSSNPLCTKVWGDIISTTITHEETIETAFGAPKVNVTSRTFRAWDVTGCAVEPYEWDDESFITKAEMKKAVEEREAHLADVRKRDEEYRNSQKDSKSAFGSKPAAKKSADAELVGSEDFVF